jgi:hypothetical protein
MQQYVPRIREIAKRRVKPIRTIELVTAGGCAPIPDLERTRMNCADFVRRGFTVAADPKVDTVVLAASWYGFATRTDYRPEGRPDEQPLQLLGKDQGWALDRLEKALEALARQGKQIVIVLSSPRGEMLNPRAWLERSLTGVRPQTPRALPRAELRELIQPIDDRLVEMASRVGARLVAPVDALCNADVCTAKDTEGHFIYMDPSHIRADYVRRKFSLLDEFVMTKTPADSTTVVPPRSAASGTGESSVKF